MRTADDQRPAKKSYKIELSAIVVYCELCQDDYSLQDLDEVATGSGIKIYMCTKHPGEITVLATIHNGDSIR